MNASCSVTEDGGGPDWHLVYRHSCGCSAEAWTSPGNFDEGAFVCPLCGRDYRVRFLGGHPKPEREVFENLFLTRVLYQPGMTCAVQGCGRHAEFEVFVHGFSFYTHDKGGILDYQDSTCPFLCREHMIENEERASGPRRWDSDTRYPHTKKDRGSGYTTYLPIADVFPLLYKAPANERVLSPIITDIDSELIEHLTKHPELLRKVDPRRFEEIIAELFKRRGFEVVLTPPTKDGGVDIYAALRDDVGALLFVIECKRYVPPRKVGIDKVQRLHGVVQAKRATKGIIATTSGFTRDAIAYAKPLEYQLTLSDFEAVKSWLRAFRN